jgi:acyl carrier protein
MAMTKEELSELVSETFVSELDGILLTNDLKLLESGIIDSFALTRLVARLEEAIPGLKIPDSDVTPEALGSVDRLFSYISQRHANSAHR